MKTSLVIVALIFLQGCSHTLYQSDIISKNNLNEDQAYRLWWIETALFSSQKGSGSMTLDMGCSSGNFTDSANGIVMKLPSDQYVSTAGEKGASLECAKVTNLNAIKDYTQGELEIVSSCEPLVDGFSVSAKTFLSVKQKHIFPVKKISVKDANHAPARVACSKPDG